MRGKGKDYRLGDKVSGITPAYAGKSKNERTRRKDLWDHPRLCGEKGCVSAIFAKYSGSPPPMRGKARK